MSTVIREADVDVLVLIASIAIAFLFINIAAVVFGTDSRDSMPDDHQRRMTEGF